MSASIAFEADVPLNPVDAGTNILVSGAESAGLSDVVQKLLCTVDDDREGMAVISTDGDRFLRSYRRVAGRDVETAIVDASGRGDGNDPTDLAGISMEFSSTTDDLSYGGCESVRSGVYSVSPLCAACDDARDVYRFLNNLTSRNRRSRGLFVCGVDPDDDFGDLGNGGSITTGISKAFHGHVELRGSGRSREVRISGLDGQPSGWQRFPA